MTAVPAHQSGGEDVSPRPSTPLSLGWSVGIVGVSVSAITVNAMLLVFMVSLLHIDAALAGALLTGVRVCDIALDTWVGTLSDRTRSRWGRRRPWLLAGGLLCPVALLMLFNPPPLPGGVAMPAYIAGVVVVFYAAYSVFSVPHMSMPIEMSDRPQDRARLMSFRAGFLAVGGLIGVGLAPKLVGMLGGGRPAFSTMSLVMGAIAFSAMLTSFACTGSARSLAPTVTRSSGLGVLRTRSFSLLLVAKFLAFSSTGLNATVGLVFHSLITRRGAEGFAQYGIGQALPALASIPVWAWLIKRYDKRWMLIASLLVFGAAWVSWALATSEDTDLLFFARCAVLGTTTTGMSFLMATILTDCADDDLARSGLRREGTMAGLFIATEKLAYAFNPLVAGTVLHATGFRSGQAISAHMVQSPSAVTGVIIVACLLPAATAWLAIIPAIASARSRRAPSKLADEVPSAGSLARPGAPTTSRTRTIKTAPGFGSGRR